MVGVPGADQGLHFLVQVTIATHALNRIQFICPLSMSNNWWRICLAGRCRIGTWNESDLFGAQKRVGGRARKQQAGQLRTFLASESAARYVVVGVRERGRWSGQLRQK